MQWPIRSSTVGEFSRGAGIAFALHLTAVGVAFVAQLLYARLLSPEAYGVLAIAVATVSVLANLLVVGIPQANLQLIPTYLARQAWGTLRGWLRHGPVQAMVAAVLFTTAALVVWWISPADVGSEWLPAALLIPPTVAIGALQSQALGFKRIVLAQAPAEIGRPLLGLLLFIGFALAGHRTPDAALWAAVIGSSLVCAVYLLRLRSVPPPAVRDAQAEHQTRAWLGTSAQFFGHGFFNVVLLRGDLILVGILLGPREAGIYAIATSVGKLLQFVLTPVNAIAGPMISGLHTRNEPTEVQQVLRAGVAASSVWSLTGAVGLFALGGLVLSLFGPEYVEGTLALQVVVIGYLFNACCGSAALVVSMAGRQDVTWKAVGLAAVLMVVLVFAWVPGFGIVGAAASRATAMMAWNLGLSVYAWRRLGYDPTVVSLFRRV